MAPSTARKWVLTVQPGDEADVVAIVTGFEEHAATGTPAWTFVAEIHAVSGVPFVATLDIDSVGGVPTGGVTADLLRTISTSAILRKVRSDLPRAAQYAVDFADASGTPLTPAQIRTLRKKVAAVRAEDLRRGRRGLPDDFYRGVALRYLELTAAGVRRGLRRQLSEEYGERLGRPIPEDTVKSWLRETKQRGFLVFDTGGVSGAAPGPNLAATKRRGET